MAQYFTKAVFTATLDRSDSKQKIHWTCYANFQPKKWTALSAFYRCGNWSSNRWLSQGHRQLCCHWACLLQAPIPLLPHLAAVGWCDPLTHSGPMWSPHSQWADVILALTGTGCMNRANPLRKSCGLIFQGIGGWKGKVLNLRVKMRLLKTPLHSWHSLYSPGVQSLQSGLRS